MKYLLPACLLYFCVLPVCAQNGSYFLTHHTPSDESFDNVSFDVAQDDYGIMYFAVKAGVLEFDGREWDLIPGAGAVYSLDKSADGDIFWAGARGFGRIGVDRKGFKRLQHLSDSTFGNAFQTLTAGDATYFLSDDRIFRYDKEDGLAKAIALADGNNAFVTMFELFGQVYVQTEQNATLQVEENQLVTANLNISGSVLFYSRIGDTYLLGTSDNRIYSCSHDLVIDPVVLKDQAYADANVVISGTWVSSDLLALGTLRGGIMLIDPNTGERKQIIDYSTGLPDNEVFALAGDANQNIWVAHEYGFTQISPSLPFRSFSYYAGLKGNLLCAYSYRGKVYVGTSLGLFKLDKEELYDELVTYVEVAASPQHGLDEGKETDNEHERAEVSQETPSKRKGLFSFLRRNRDKASDRSRDTQNGRSVSDPPDSKQATRKRRRVEKVLRSSQHVYKQVAGIAAKISHLAEVDGKLVAAGLEGVFHIDGLIAEPVMDSPTRYVYASDLKHTLIVSTYNDEIWGLKYDGGWQKQNLISDIGDQIEFVLEGKGDEWWLCGLSRIFQVEFGGDSIRHLRTVELSNPNFEKTVGVFSADETVFVNNDGFFRFDRNDDRLIRIDSLPRPFQYFALDRHILYRDNHRWSILGENGDAGNVHLLNLFNNLRYITKDQDPQNLWIISGNNELLKFEGNKVTPIQNRFPVFLKSVQNNTTKIADFSRIQIDQTNSAVTFEVVQPDFINPKSIEFRYFLEGMHHDWSDWSSGNNKIAFPYLPPGDYNLRVQARNIFGRISNLTPISFEVIPPYWKRWWFYALEFVIFASLVILSFRLSGRYHIVSRLLSLITIILFIEFIQTVIGASIISGDSPVVEFFIQVVVALLVLPVEGFLRNLMLRSLDTDSKLYRLIAAGEVPKSIKNSQGKQKVEETL